MIRELQEMGRAFQAGCATIGTLFRWGAAMAVVLAVLVNYGLSSLLSVTIVLGFLFGPSFLFGHTEEDEKDEDVDFKAPRFGPTDNQRYYDPAYNVYAENCFHKRFHGKD